MKILLNMSVIATIFVALSSSISARAINAKGNNQNVSIGSPQDIRSVKQVKNQINLQESIFKQNISTVYEEVRKYQEKLYQDNRHGGRGVSDRMTFEFNRIWKDIETRQKPSRLSLPDRIGITLQQTGEDITELTVSSFKTSTKVIATVSQIQDIAESIKSLASINQETLNRIAGGPKYVLAVQEILKDAGEAFVSFDSKKMLDTQLKAAQETIELINSQDKRVASSGNAIKAYLAAKELIDKDKLLRQPQIYNTLDNYDKFYLAAAQLSKTVDVIIAGLAIPFSETKVIDKIVERSDAVNTLLFDALEFSYKSDIRRKYVRLQAVSNHNQIAISGLSSFVDYSAEEVGKYLLQTRTDVVTRRADGSITVSVNDILYPQ